MQNKLHTIWIGDLESYMDELFIKRAFESLGETVLSVKLYRNKGQVSTSSAFAYGFIEFSSQNAAREVLMRHNNKPVPGSMPVKLFKLKSTTNSLVGGTDASATFSLHVSSLSHIVDDYALYEAFKKYASCSFAKVIYDHVTGVSRRFGFVNFSSQTEMNRAYREMQGYVLCGAPIYLNLNLHSKKSAAQTEGHSGFEGPPPSSNHYHNSGMSAPYSAPTQPYYNYYQQPYGNQGYGYDQSSYGYAPPSDHNSHYGAYQQSGISNNSTTSIGNSSAPPANSQQTAAATTESDDYLPESIDGINSAEYLNDEHGDAFDYLEASRWTFMDEQLKNAVCSSF